MLLVGHWWISESWHLFGPHCIIWRLDVLTCRAYYVGNGLPDGIEDSVILTVFTHTKFSPHKLLLYYHTISFWKTAPQFNKKNLNSHAEKREKKCIRRRQCLHRARGCRSYFSFSYVQNHAWFATSATPRTCASATAATATPWSP